MYRRIIIIANVKIFPQVYIKQVLIMANVS